MSDFKPGDTVDVVWDDGHVWRNKVVDSGPFESTSDGPMVKLVGSPFGVYKVSRLRKSK